MTDRPPRYSRPDVEQLANAIHAPHESLIRSQASPRRQAIRSRKCRTADYENAQQIAAEYARIAEQEGEG